MIRCPHCNKGLLWGIYLDIPPEMKSGEAQWLACDPPEGDAIVTCPTCKEEAGPYSKLFASDRENRTLERDQQKKEQFEQISIGELPGFFVVGSLQMGNYARTNFLNDAWQEFHPWLSKIRKKRLLVSQNQKLPEEVPEVIGLRLDNPLEESTSKCHYLACVPFSEELLEKIRNRIHNREFDDPKKLQIERIPSGLYAKYHFKGEEEEFHKIHNFMCKTWLNEKNYVLRDGCCLELYKERISKWPSFSKESGLLEITFCIPIEKPPPETSENNCSQE